MRYLLSGTLFLASLLCCGQAVGQTTVYYGNSAGQGGDYNTHIGLAAGHHNDSNTKENTIVGSLAGSAQPVGVQNSFFGYLAGERSVGAQNLFVGARAGLKNSGSYNTFLGGYDTGLSNTTGSYNVYVGNHAGQDATVTLYNTLLGYAAGRAIKSGNGVTAVGYEALGNTVGDAHRFGTVAVGRSAGNYSRGDHSVYVGIYSAQRLNGSYNIAVGYRAGESVPDAEASEYNLFVGAESGSNVNGGDNNVFLGHFSGSSASSGSNNVFLGNNSGHDVSTGKNNVCIGYNAGRGATEVDGKLYISSYDSDPDNDNVHSADDSPLIYGDFLTGQVAIGTTRTSDGTHDYALTVAGKTASQGVKVTDVSGWPDYVFEDGYELKSLEEVESFIQKNGHLPNVPSAEETEASGFFLEEMDATLLRKIEELTLYSIALKKQNDAAKEDNEQLAKDAQAAKQEAEEAKAKTERVQEELDAVKARLAEIERLLLGNRN